MNNLDLLSKHDIKQGKDLDYPVDFVGRKFEIGQLVAKCTKHGHSPALELRKVEKIEGKSVWTSDGEGGRLYKQRNNSTMVIV